MKQQFNTLPAPQTNNIPKSQPVNSLNFPQPNLSNLSFPGQSNANVQLPSPQIKFVHPSQSQPYASLPQYQMQQPYQPQNQIPFQNYLPQQQQMVQNFQSQIYSSYSNNPIVVQSQQSKGISLLKAKDPSKKIAAIIVSFQNGCSYDDLFRRVQQKTMEGTQVLVYSCSANSVNEICNGFKGTSLNEDVKALLSNIKQVYPDCVVFNWQCSSSYSEEQFTEDRNAVMNFLKIILDAGHMAMFSDFSLKALIKQWDQSILGKNPFVKTGETCSEVILKFKPSVLKECPSAQLQIVGDMAEGGRCNLHTLGQTILYSVNKNNIDVNSYSLQVLTINITNPPHLAEHRLEVQGEIGSAGHVLLRYKKGGCLLTSMGHWVELMKIDTSEKKLFEIAERQYGAAYAMEMKSQYAQMDVSSQRAYVQTQAMNFVQNQQPCSNMNKKGGMW